MVITSTSIPAYARGLASDFGADPDGIKVVRLKPKFELGQVVVAGGIEKALLGYSPDRVIVIGLGKRFPKPLYDLDFETITLLGDNSHSYVKQGWKNRMFFNLFKRSTYKKAIAKSSALVAYTPESFQASAKMVGGKYRNKLMQQNAFISLGFWPHEFYFNPDFRYAKRAELGFSPESRVMITATRLVPEKKLESLIGLFASLPAHYIWLIVGSKGDHYSVKFEAALKQMLHPSRFRVLPFADKAALKKLYNASDAALYTVPAISMLEAAGTGLPLIIPTDKSTEQLAAGGIPVMEFKADLEPLMAALGGLDVSDRKRLENARRAGENFGWPKIATHLMAFEMTTEH